MDPAVRLLMEYVINDSVLGNLLTQSTVIKPPFNEETARTKVKAAQDAWNTRDPDVVAKAYTLDSQWRNRTEFFNGKTAIIEFLRRKWAKELDYRLMKEALVLY